jgi:thymidylate synthase
MYLPIEPQPSCALAWLAATQSVDAQPDHEAHNVIIGVDNPLAESFVDEEIIKRMDSFLREQGHLPVPTVANTIFPQSIYDRHGSPDFYSVYLEKVYPRIKKSQGDWGRYFERMISFPLNKKGVPINPLQDIVDKMRKQMQGPRCFKNVYELTIYDPIRDAGPVMNRQCLSFLSFKLTAGEPRRLLLTAVYRNHYYVERLLGNLIGLGRLMRFVANEVGASVGDLTIVSSHAEIDSAAPREKITHLLRDCASLLQAPATVPA